MTQYYSSDNVLEEFYKNLASGRSSRFVHIPLSSVFYVRTAIHESTGILYSLDRIERAMLKEGLISRYDCFQPDQVRDWEQDYNQFDEDYKVNNDP